MRSIILDLPWPPSVNGYYVCQQSRKLLSREGRDYAKTVAALVMIRRQGLNLSGRLAVQMDAYPPSACSRDIDNLLKACLDSLQKAGVFVNDSQIDDLAITRRPVCAGGKMIVKVTEIG